MKRLLMVLLLLLPLASAQRLAELAPPDSLLTLGWSLGESVIDSLADDFAVIDWDAARDAVDKMLLLLEEEVADADEAVLLEIVSEILAGDFSLDDLNDEIMAEAYAVCPDLEGYLERFADVHGHAQVEALFTLSMNSFSPLPAATALLKVAEVDDATFGFSAFQDVIIQCANLFLDVVRLEQDGVPIYVLDDGGDLPLIIAKVGNVFALSTQPDVLRAVVRRGLGSDEPGFADTDLYQRGGAVLHHPNSLTLTLNFAAMADVASGFVGMVIDGPETEVLVTRGLAFLRTLGGYAGSLYLSSDGLVFENITTVNPEGGDAALAQLLLCQTCAVSNPFLVPETSVSTWSQNIPLRALFHYAQDWLDDLEPLVGESLDIKLILREEFGFNLDTALFNWIGEELHWAQLEAFNFNIADWFYGSPQIFYVPVVSQEAAEEGLDLWASILAPYANTIFAALNGFGADFDLDYFFDDLSFRQAEVTFVQRDFSYRDVNYRRLQSGLNIDIATGFIGNYLVIAMPADAMLPAIDTFLGAASILENPHYRRIDRSGVTVASALEDEQHFVAWSAELFRVLAQPAAYGLSFLAQEELWYAEPEVLPSYGDWLRLTEVPAQVLTILANHVSTTEATVKIENNTIHRHGLTRIRW